MRSNSDDSIVFGFSFFFNTRTQAIERVLEVNADFIIFADAGLDSRTFALAHERLALWQGVLWGWGGTLGIPTVDYYFIPDILWTHSRCPKTKETYRVPQELFMEQVIWHLV